MPRVTLNILIKIRTKTNSVANEIITCTCAGIIIGELFFSQNS